MGCFWKRLCLAVTVVTEKDFEHQLSCSQFTILARIKSVNTKLIYEIDGLWTLAILWPIFSESLGFNTMLFQWILFTSFLLNVLSASVSFFSPSLFFFLWCDSTLCVLCQMAGTHRSNSQMCRHWFLIVCPSFWKCPCLILSFSHRHLNRDHNPVILVRCAG